MVFKGCDLLTRSHTLKEKNGLLKKNIALFLYFFDARSLTQNAVTNAGKG